jgi:hypothetical protein
MASGAIENWFLNGLALIKIKFNRIMKSGIETPDACLPDQPCSATFPS